MSSDLRETSLDKLVALNGEYYYYSLPLAAKQLRYRPVAEINESAVGEPAAPCGWRYCAG